MADAPAGGGHRRPRVLGGAALAVAALLAGSAAWSAAGGAVSATPTHTTNAAATNLSANASSFTYTPGAAGLAISGEQFTRGEPGTLSLTVYGQPAADGSASAGLTADLVNQTATPVPFPDGPHVTVQVTHDGTTTAVTLSQATPTSLAPGQEVTLQGSVALGGAGSYTVSGSLAGR